jgi:diguanylate cyclase (GGDEF)-like protein
MSPKDREKILHLLVVQDSQGKRIIHLQEATYSLGRDCRNEIVLHSRLVSRQHAILLRVTLPETDQYAFRIIDGSFRGKKSTNGLFVNGVKCFSHDLQHGDTIEFGSNQVQAKYYVISRISAQAFSQSYFLENLSDSAFLQGDPINPFETLSVEDDNLERASEVAVVSLASFPELIPNPIVEMDMEGTLTCPNPAAKIKFPELKKFEKQHPLLTELVTAVKNQKVNSFIREVEVGKEVFEQSVHYLPESDLIRTFVIREITQKKQAEAELYQRDRLLQAVAEAANYLLVEMNYEIAIEKALAVLGDAARADRVCLFENNPHPITGEMAINLRFEWTRLSVKSCRHNWQNQPYRSSGLDRWYTTFSKGEFIRGLTREFTPCEQKLLQRDGVQSLLLVPLRFEEKFWGFLGLLDCSQERQWSKHEESTLLTLAASISAARQRRQVEEMIRYQALHDALTGLPNRLQFNEQLTKALANAVESRENLAVMFLDLDRFKTINDTLGHKLGDLLLQSVAQRLCDSLRSGDTVARWGGDEFIILLPRVTSTEEVAQIAKRILQALEKAFQLEGHELYITGSIGITLFNKDAPKATQSPAAGAGAEIASAQLARQCDLPSCHGAIWHASQNGWSNSRCSGPPPGATGAVADAEVLIQQADIAVYHAKQQGRNNYQFYTTSIKTKTPEVLIIEKSLRHALEKEEFVVYYQPQVNIRTGQITGMEALLRWNHPEMGLIAPNVFIPLAEESGLIVTIGEWVLRTACMQNKAWQNAGLPALTMAVNLSLKQFREPKLVQTVAQILEQTGLEARFLELEITETVAIEDLDFTKKVLQQFQQMGVRLSIDDFGTGHSSLSRLQLLPLHNLKIDRSFIRELTTDVRVAHIVKAIVSLGRNLGLRLTAEGVEKQEELEFLKSINCEDVQGFLFYKPLCAQKATEILYNQTTKSHCR